MADAELLQIPESERGEILATVSVDKARVANQARGYRKTLVLGIVGVIAGVLLTVVSKGSFGAIVVIVIFGFLLLLAGYRMWVASTQQNAKEENLVAYQVRKGGVLIPADFFIPWGEIDSATYEWRQAGGGIAVGLAGAAAKSAYDASMAAHQLDNAKRVITFTLSDYKKTNARSKGKHIGMITSPGLGFPGLATVNLSGTIDDDVFKNLLDVTQRELVALNKPFAKWSQDAEIAAMDARRAAKKAAQEN